MRADDEARRAATLARLAALLRREVPLPVALRSVGGAPAGVALAEEGRPLAEALGAAGLLRGAEPALVHAAATGPDPARGVRLLAGELRALSAARSAFRQALVWPAMKVLVGIVLVALGGALVAAQGLAALRGSERWPGRALVTDLQAYVATAALLLALLALAWLLLRTRPGLSLLERAARDLPWVGALLRCEVTARTLRVVGTGLTAGLPLAEALSRARDAFGRRPAARELDGAIAAAREGQGLVGCLAATPCADTTAQWLAAVAVDRADAPRELLALADSYEERLVRECAHLAPVVGGLADVAYLLAVGFPLGFLIKGVRGVMGLF